MQQHRAGRQDRPQWKGHRTLHEDTQAPGTGRNISRRTTYYVRKYDDEVYYDYYYINDYHYYYYHFYPPYFREYRCHYDRESSNCLYVRPVLLRQL